MNTFYIIIPSLMLFAVSYYMLLCRRKLGHRIYFVLATIGLLGASTGIFLQIILYC